MSTRDELRRVLDRTRSITRSVGPHPIVLARSLAFVYDRRRRGSKLAAGRIRAKGAQESVSFLDLDIPTFDDLPEELRMSATAIRDEAQLVAEHTVDYLGSGRVDLGSTISWHTDFKSGFRWPMSDYRSLQVFHPPVGADPKVPWELSRGHQFLSLARAARIYEWECYAETLYAQLFDWIEANPPYLGVNWSNAMEAGIRLTNWLWALSTVAPLRPPAPADHQSIASAVYDHAIYIRANLEGTPQLRSNHYLGDLLGLMAAAVLLPDADALHGWNAFAREQLEREICKQVYEDGVSFEGSIAYHGLAMEIFAIALYLAEASGATLSPSYRSRLRAMVQASAALRHDDGRIPLVGDQDSGRVLPEGFIRPPTHDNLIWLTTACLQDSAPLEGRPHPEVAWTLGLSAWCEVSRSPSQRLPRNDAWFPVSRLLVARSRRFHAVFTFGALGQNGNGGHGHNDTGSFELSCDRRPIIVDSGTYTYTPDPEARNAFRSTRAHNVVTVDGLEINPIAPDRLFELRQHARVRVHDVGIHGNVAKAVVSHDGFRRRGDYVMVRRTATLDKVGEILTIEDYVVGGGVRDLELRLHFAQRVACELSDGQLIASVDGVAIQVTFDRRFQVELGETWISEQYGVKALSVVAVARLRERLPLEIALRISPASGDRLPRYTERVRT